jgi:hypothetical protein
VEATPSSMKLRLDDTIEMNEFLKISKATTLTRIEHCRRNDE